jgi:signal transduction histidine kinase
MEPEKMLPKWPVSWIGRAVVTTLVAGFSLALGALVARQLGAPWMGAVLGSLAGVAVSAVVVLAARRSEGRYASGDPSPHKRALDQLSEELTSLASPNDVAGAIERTIRRLLPCDAVEVSFAPKSSTGAARGPAGSADRAESGEHAIVDPSRQGDEQQLTCPIEFHGAKLGRLRVRREGRSPRFSAEESELLRAIAHEGGLALANAVAYSELEKRRKQQAAAWRDEREALVETLSAEIAHEVRYPINFFRTIFQRASSYRVLEEEDIEIGCEEVDRLERLVSGLRRMATQQVERRVVDVGELCGRAEVLLRDRMASPLVLHLDEEGGIHCDIDKITQVLVNLLANALEATDGKGEVGVDWTWSARGGELSVWDTGPGFSGDPARLFAPWYTTKTRGTGLGLAITHRLVRAHGWNIEATRRDSKTLFIVAVPPGDIITRADQTNAGLRGPKKGEVA